MRPAIEKFVRIFATTVPAFFARENPISRNAKPACIQITSSAATTTQIELIATLSGNTPLLAASSVSALATAGSAAQASATPSSAAPLLLLIGPPRPETIRLEWSGEKPRGVFVPVSKIRGRGFSIRSSVRAGERAWSILGHVDNDLAREAELVCDSTQDSSPEEDPRRHGIPYTYVQCSRRAVEPERRRARPGRPDPARRQRLRRGGVLDRRAAPAPAQDSSTSSSRRRSRPARCSSPRSPTPSPPR